MRHWVLRAHRRPRKFSLRALAEIKSPLHPENRDRDAAREAAVEANCREEFTGYDRVAGRRRPVQVRRVRPRKVAFGFHACSAGSSPAQRVCPNRPLPDTICRRIRCLHSLRRSQTGKMLALPSLVFRTSLVQYRFAFAAGNSPRCSSIRQCSHSTRLHHIKSTLHFRCVVPEQARRGLCGLLRSITNELKPEA